MRTVCAPGRSAAAFQAATLSGRAGYCAWPRRRGGVGDLHTILRINRLVRVSALPRPDTTPLPPTLTAAFGPLALIRERQPGYFFASINRSNASNNVTKLWP